MRLPLNELINACVSELCLQFKIVIESKSFRDCRNTHPTSTTSLMVVARLAVAGLVVDFDLTSVKKKTIA